MARRRGPALRDPEACPYFCCLGRSRVTQRRKRDGVVWRRHRCRRCGRTWTSWQSLVDPRLVDPDDVDPALLAAPPKKAPR